MRKNDNLEEASTSGLYVSQAAAQLSVVLLAVVCIGYGGLSYVGAAQNFDKLDATVSLFYTLGILALQLGYFSRPHAPLRPGRSAVALVALACLVYLPVLHLHQFWTGFSSFLAGSLLIALPVRWGVAGFTAVVAASSLLLRTFGQQQLQPTYAIAYTVISTLITGLVVFGLTRLARLVYELHEARIELSRMAVAEERLRFARDAHDLLGMSLSAITLKAELAHRLLGTDPGRAREEVEELLVASRRALGEVRMVASGYTELSLAEELSSARKVLQAADVDATFRGEWAALDDEAGTLFATVLREAVTNILRHSKADFCAVSVSLGEDGARIAITNDRAGESGGLQDDGPGRRGIGNLRQRFHDLGGDLRVSHEDDEFTVVGTLPAHREGAEVTASRPRWRSGWRRRGSGR